MTMVENGHATNIKTLIMMTNINTQTTSNGCEKRVMFYPTKYEINTGKQETVESIIKGIRSKISRDFIVKEKLPVAYFSVMGFKGNKTHNNVTEHSGLIVIDLDVKDNPDTDFEELYNNLQWNTYIFACFRSPNNGIKLIFNTDITEIHHHKAYYQAITEYLLKRYKEIIEIDTSGSDVNRACYLPFNTKAYHNPNAYIFKVSQDYIDEYIKAHPKKPNKGSSPKPLLQVKYLSYHDHYVNIMEVICNWTSMGIEMNLKGTPVGIGNSGGLPSAEDSKGTSMGLEEDKTGTSVGLYDCIFNEFRFHGIKDSVMRTDVPFFEILFLKYCTPSKVEKNTRLDEIYFKDFPDKRLSTDDFEGLDGLEVCEEKPIVVIKEGKRGKTLTSICMRLIFNNPFCHPAIIAKELQSINYHYCEDPNPKNPAPDETEINAIVSTCYQKFINGELDFTTVMRKKKNYKDISKRKVFCSKYHEKMTPNEKRIECNKTFTDAKRKKNIRRYEKTVLMLQDGEKITVKRIAEYMGLSPKQVSRYRTDERYNELMETIQIKIDEYNKSLKA